MNKINKLFFTFIVLSLTFNNVFATQNKKDVVQYDVYLLLGQSNMAGRGTMITADTATISNVFLLNDDGIPVPAHNPLNKYSSVRKDMSMQQIGPGLSFSQKLARETGHKILLVVNALGGSSITAWKKDSPLVTDLASIAYGQKQCYAEAVRRAKQAQEYGELKGIIWHQGEANINSANTYMSVFVDIMNGLREDLQAPNALVIAGELNYWQTQNATFNTMLHDIALYLPKSGWASAEGLTMLKDVSDPHFSRTAQLIFGERFADKVLSLDTTTTPPPPTTTATITLNPTADVYTTSSANDNTNFGVDPYFKVGYNAANTRLKFNSFLKFRMTDELFANLANVTSIELGMYSDASGLSTARQFKVAYVPTTPAANIWTESIMSGTFRSTMVLTSPSMYTFSKADSDPAKWYSMVSTALSNSSMFNSITLTYNTEKEINLTLTPSTTFDATLNPNQNDAIGINFVSKDNPNYTSFYYPYLKFTYTQTTALKENKLQNIRISANSTGFKVQNIETNFNVRIFNLMGKTLYSANNLAENESYKTNLKHGIYLFKVTGDSNDYLQKILITN